MTTQETNLTSIEEQDANNSEGIVGGLMLWVAVRCTLQYVALPFILPLVGLSGSASLWISVAVSAFALGMMAFNLRRLWRTNWRWRYLTMSAIAGAVIVMFLVLDIQELAGA